jgi:peptidoglycan hydrolase CwlO-like protein
MEVKASVSIMSGLSMVAASIAFMVTVGYTAGDAKSQAGQNDLEISALREANVTLQSDTNHIKEDIQGIKKDVSDLNDKVDVIGKSQIRQEALSARQEEVEERRADTLDRILEVLEK